MNDPILAITVLLGLEEELWFHHNRDADCWKCYLTLRRN